MPFTMNAGEAGPRNAPAPDPKSPGPASPGWTGIPPHDETPPAPPSVTPGGDSAALEALGWKRPDVFPNMWSEIGCCFSVNMSIWCSEYFISGFNTVLPPISQALDIPPDAATWPSSVFPLVAGALLLPAARLADMYGPRIVFIGGMAWFAAVALGCGFSKSYSTLVACRALQAIGAAGFSPTALMLLGTIYRPGPRKNIVFGIYGALAPLGFFSGVLFGGLASQYLNWRAYFWLGCIISSVVVAVAFFSVPSISCGAHGGAESTSVPTSVPTPTPTPISMDWLGLVTIVPGIIMVVFALTDNVTVPDGFATPYIIATFVLGVLLLVAAVYVEGWVATNPLLPPSLFRVKSMKPLITALFLVYGVFGLYLFYSTFYIENILHVSPVMTAVYYIPLSAGGILISTAGGAVLHRIPGTILLLISNAGYLTSVLLFAVMPASPSLTVKYWAFIMPAMLASTIGIDISWTVANVFITTSLPARSQGVAAALICSLIFVGMGFWLGIANLAVSAATRAHNLDPRSAYRVGFWLGFAMSLLALVNFCMVRVDKAKSDLTVEEKAAAMIVTGATTPPRAAGAILGEENA